MTTTRLRERLASAATLRQRRLINRFTVWCLVTATGFRTGD